MRLGRVSLLSLGALVPLASAYQAQQPLQVYLHPSPSDAASKAAPTLTADQAKAVLSHHLGESIGDFDEIPDDEGLWGHLLNMWGGEQKQFGGQKSRIVIIEGGVSPQEVLPSTLSQSPSFYMKEETTTRALLAPYLQRASSFLEDILASIPALTNKFKDAFDLAGSRAAQALGKELSCLTALAESIPWIDHSKHAYPWEAITIAGLGHVDRDDEVWETGRQTVKAGLQAMTTPDSPPLLLIIVPSQSGNVKRQSWAELANPLDLLSEEYEEYFGEDQPIEALQKDNRTTTTAEACYPDQDTCSSSTTCSGRGSCILKTRNGDKECWGCKCANGYAGQSCQKADYTVPFVILILTALLFLGLLGGSISLLYSVGETKLPSTLNLAVGGPSKRD